MMFQVRATKQTFSSFDDMLKNCEVPVLVDFYAVWYAHFPVRLTLLNSRLMDVSRTGLNFLEQFQYGGKVFS